MPKNTRTRRSNGDGQRPYQRPDGRWQIKLRVSDTTTGEPTRKTFNGATRADVVAKLKQYRNALATGTLADPNHTTLEAWCTHWLVTIAQPRLKETTWYSYRNALNKWVIGTREGKIKLEKLNPTHIERIHARMRQAGRSETTVLNIHRILSKALKDAVSRGQLGNNPAAKVQAPSATRFAPVVLDQRKVRAMLKSAAADEEQGPGWIVALALGLRQGERLGLCLDDVDLEKKTLRIERELTTLPWKHDAGCGCAADVAPRFCPDRTGGGYVMLPTKSDRGRRVLPLPGPVADALRRQIEQQEKLRVQAGSSWTGFTDWRGRSWDLLFSQADGRPINNKTDRTAWKAFTKAHGVKGMRVHDARHTAATVLLTMNVAPRVVMELMGWSQVGMLTRYQHVLNEMRVEAAGRVEAALWGPEPDPEPAPEAGGNVVRVDFRRRRSG